jgi:hypothetical protein
MEANSTNINDKKTITSHLNCTQSVPYHHDANNSASSSGQCTLDVNVRTWEGGGLYIQNYSGYHHN